MADTQVYVTTLATGTAIDNISVTTGAGSVNRQRTTERDLVTENDASVTVSTSAVTAIAAGLATNWVDIENVSTNGNTCGFTFDGSTPVIGAAGTFTLLPYGTKTYDKRIPTAKLQIIGSAASTAVTIKYA
jgi:hypothetical protein